MAGGRTVAARAEEEGGLRAAGPGSRTEWMAISRVRRRPCTRPIGTLGTFMVISHQARFWQASFLPAPEALPAVLVRTLRP